MRKRNLWIALFLTICTLGQSQVLQMEMGTTDKSFVNETICFNHTIWNDGDVGYQPYLRVFLPPSIPVETFQMTMFGQGLTDFYVSDVFQGETISDPLLYSDSPYDAVSGPDGYRMFTVSLPIGSLVSEDIQLAVEGCGMLLESELEIGSPVSIFSQVMFRYGDTPTGVNGATEGPLVEIQTIPTIYSLSTSAENTETTIGSCWGIVQEVVVNVADQTNVTDLGVGINLPDEHVFDMIMDVTPGCFVSGMPSDGTNGGSITINCGNINGTAEGDDVRIQYMTHFDNVLSTVDCDSINVSVDAGMFSNEGPAEASSIELWGHQSTWKASVIGEDLAPGISFIYALDFGVSEFITSLDSAWIAVLIPDGIEFLNNVYFQGEPITDFDLQDLGGDKLLQFDLLQNVLGGLNSCYSGVLTIDMSVAEQFEGGGFIMASESFGIEGSVHLRSDNFECDKSFGAVVSTPGITTHKSIINEPADGFSFVPGEVITYRLMADIPGGNYEDVKFEDLLPLPLHDVDAINLTWGTDVRISDQDNSGLTPVSITKESGKNKLIIDWGTIQNPLNEDITIAIELDAQATDLPFSNGLSHSNIALYSGSNSVGNLGGGLNIVSINAGAPNLQLYKGVSDTDNPNELLTSGTSPTDADVVNIDAWDWITFEITLVNNGNAPAYDIIVYDNVPDPEMDQCYILAVENSLGEDMLYDGDLFTTGLVIDTLSNNIPGTDNEAIISYRCRAQGEIVAKTNFSNEASATWAATVGNPDRYSPVTDIATMYTAIPRLDAEIIDIQPGYAGENQAHIGELVTVKVEITYPEGKTNLSTFYDLLPQGLAFEEWVSVEASEDLEFSAGSLVSIVNNSQINPYGVGEGNAFRELEMYFGDVQNNSANNLVDEKVTIIYKATVLNIEENQHGVFLEHFPKVKYENPSNNGFPTAGDFNLLEIIEPELISEISFLDEEVVPGETTFVNVLFSHSDFSETNAYDVEFQMDLPLGMQLIEGSFLMECDSLLAVEPSGDFGYIYAKWDSIPNGVNCELVFSVIVDESYPPCTDLNTCGNIQWRSVYEPHVVELEYGPLNVLGLSRTGDVGDEGGDANTYLSDSCPTLEIVSAQAFTPVIFGETNVCVGSDITLNIAEYQGVNVNYYWTGPGIPAGFNSNELELESINDLVEGSYDVYVTIGDCITDLSEVFELNVNENPEVDLESFDLPCSDGTEDITFIPEITGGTGPFEYQWSGPDWSSTVSQPTILNVQPEDEGIYSLVVTDVYNCESNAGTSSISISSSPQQPQIIQEDPVCSGEDIILWCTEYLGDNTYHWNTPEGPQTTFDPFIQITNSQPEDSGNYSVWVEINECVSDTSSQSPVVIYPQPLAPSIEGSFQNVCEGENITLYTTAEANSYEWTGPNGFFSTLANPPIILNSTMNNAGAYELTVTSNGCESPVSSFEISILEAPSSPQSSSNSPICEGDDLIVESSTSAQAYMWTLPDNSTITTADPLLEIINTDGSSSGQILLNIYDGQCWSFEPAVETIQIDMIPNEEAFAGSDVVVCPGENLFIESLNSPNLSGFWTTDNPAIEFSSPSNNNTFVWGVNEGQEYSVYWTLSNEGCGAFSSDEILIIGAESPLVIEDYYELDENGEELLYITENDPIADELNLEIIQHPLNGTAVFSVDNNIIYNPYENFSGVDSLIYEACLPDCPNLCDTAIVKLVIEPFLFIPDVITPNNDGFNDQLIIAGLENFPDHKFTIFNRWGRSIIDTDNYDNSWNGEFQGNPLPDGTYFYVFTNTDTGENMVQGYVTLQR